MTPSLQRLLGYVLCSILPIAALCVLIHEVGALHAFMSLGILALIIGALLSLPLGLTLVDHAKTRQDRLDREHLR